MPSLPMSSMPISRPAIDVLRPAIAEAARAAGAAIMAIYADGFDARSKADASPVTDADEAAEAVILEALRTLAPDIPVVAEEAVSQSGAPEVGARFWLVDPLDGTREFINRNGEFTVNIALVEDGLPVLGVVYLPAQDLLYDGAAGQGARRVGAAGDEAIAVRRADPQALDVLASRNHRDAETDAFLARLHVRHLVAAGSSLKFCRVAEGSADLYPRFGPTMEWDTAAGHAVLLAAGGTMTLPDGTPFRYGKPGFRNGAFLACGGGLEGLRAD